MTKTPQPPSPTLSNLPIEIRLKIETVCQQFETALQAKESPEIETFLADHSELPHDQLLCELLAQELQYHAKMGQTPELDSYLTRFSECPASVRRAFVIVSPVLPPSRIDDELLESDITAELRYFGEYELLREISRGGMGIVYLARQKNLGRIVAIKMILAGLLASDQEVKRFKTEARSAAQLDHPGIVPIYDIGEHQGKHYYAMAYIDGPSLSDQIKGGPLEPYRASEIIRQSAEAVQAAHDRSVLHRDIKPANILLTYSDQPKITDFGLAKMTNSESGPTMTGQILGTPGYMAPEQAAGVGKVSFPADIYALGATLYALLTGRAPFVAANALETIRQVKEVTPVAPRLLNPSIPPRLEAVCMKCLRKKPSHRYRTADDLAAALASCFDTDGMPVPLKPKTQKDTTETSGSIVTKPPQPQRSQAQPQPKKPTKRAGDSPRFRQPRFIIGGVIGAVLLTFLTVWIVQLLTPASSQENKEQPPAGQQVVTNKKTTEIKPPITKPPITKPPIVKPPITKPQPPSGSVAQHTLKGHTDSVNTVCISPDGRHIVSGSHDKTIKVWNRATGKLQHTLKGHAEWVHYACISPDGRHIVSGSHDKTIKVWNLATGKLQHTLKGHTDGVNSVCISPDGQQIVSGSNDKTLKVWNLATGQLQRTLKGHTDTVKSVCISPDGQHIVSGSKDKTVKVWNLITGKLQHTLKGHTDWVHCAYISPDGRHIVSGSKDKTMKVWNLATGELQHTLKGHTGNIRSVYISPDNRTIVSGSKDKTVKVWNLATGELQHTLKGHTDNTRSVYISPDNRTIVSGSQDKTVKVWNLATGELQRTLNGHTDWIVKVCISPDGNHIISGSVDKTVKVWNLTANPLITKPQPPMTTPVQSTLNGHTKELNDIAITPDGNTLVSASSDQTLKIWDMKTGTLKRTLTGHTTEVLSVAISPDGQTIASTGSDKKDTWKIWNLQTGQLIHSCTNAKRRLWKVIFSPDGKHLVTASYGGQIRIFDVNTGKKQRIFTGETKGAVLSLAFSPDGRTLVSGTAREVKEVNLWDWETGKLLQTMTGHTGMIPTVAISPDGQTIVSGSKDKTIKVWDAKTGNLRHTMTGYTSGDEEVAISADGNSVISGSWDGKLKIWDLKTGKLQKTLGEHFDGIRTLLLAPDGQTIVTGGGDKKIKIWDIKTGTLQRTIGSTGKPEPPSSGNGQTSQVHSMTITADGRTLVAAYSNDTVKFWNLKTGKLQQEMNQLHNGVVRQATVTPDGLKLVSAGKDKTVKIWDRKTKKLLQTLSEHQAKFGMRNALISPDGKIICSVSGGSKTIKLWDLKTGKLQRTLTGHRDWVSDAAISPDGRTLISASRDQTIKIWDLKTGQLQATLTEDNDEEYVQTVLFSPDGRTIVSTGYIKTTKHKKSKTTFIKIWDFKTRKRQHTIIRDKQKLLDRGFAISPDNRTLAFAGQNETVRIWDLKTGKLLRTLNESLDGTSCVQFSLDGHHVITGDINGIIKIWDFKTGTLLRTILMTNNPKHLNDQDNAAKTTAPKKRTQLEVQTKTQKEEKPNTPTASSEKITSDVSIENDHVMTSISLLPEKKPNTPTAYSTKIASYVGTAKDDVMAGVSILPNGHIVFAGIFGDKSIIQIVNNKGKKIKAINLPGKLTDLTTDANGNIYVIGNQGAFRFTNSLTRKQQYNLPELNLLGKGRISVSENGLVVVLAHYRKSQKRKYSVFLFPKDKTKAKLEIAIKRAYVEDISCAPDGSFYVVGYDNKKATDSRKTWPVQVAAVEAYSPSGKRIWVGYGWKGQKLRDEKKRLNLMADTRAYRVEFKDGKLYIAGESAGGNTIWFRCARDLNKRLNKSNGRVSGDRYQNPYNTGSNHITAVVRLDAKTGITEKTTLILSRIGLPNATYASKNKGNTVRVRALAIDNDGNIYIGGTFFGALPREPKGIFGTAETVSGGSYLIALNPNFQRIITTGLTKGIKQKLPKKLKIGVTALAVSNKKIVAIGTAFGKIDRNNAKSKAVDLPREVTPLVRGPQGGMDGFIISISKETVPKGK